MGGDLTRALIRDVQYHPVTDQPEHVDFQRLASGELIRVSVPVHFDNELASPGLKRGGGAAGHNGLRSMDRHLATPEYWRVRLGIGHPGDKARVHGHVLGDFHKVDRDWLVALLDAVANAAPLLAGGKPEDFMTRVALLTQETR